MPNNLKLELTPLKKSNARDPVISRRQSLIKGIDTQLFITKELLITGSIPKNINNQRTYSPWFWLDQNGKYLLSINYGKKPVELAKGKFSILCTDLENVKDSLLTVRDAVQRGDLDKQLQNRSYTIRSNFMKV